MKRGQSFARLVEKNCSSHVLNAVLHWRLDKSFALSAELRLVDQRNAPNVVQKCLKEKSFVQNVVRPLINIIFERRTFGMHNRPVKIRL